MDNQKRKIKDEVKKRRHTKHNSERTETKLARAIRNTTPEEWQRKLKISKFILETVPNKNTVYH